MIQDFNTIQCGNKNMGAAAVIFTFVCIVDISYVYDRSAEVPVSI